MDPLHLLSTAFAFFVVAVSPGPANISNAAIAMSQGRKVSLVYGAGLSLGLVFWGLVAASGLGAVLQTSLYLLTVLKLLGGLYLLWLAVSSARNAWKSGPEELVTLTGNRWFLRGLLLNLSNPKSVIAWMAALSVGMSADSGLFALVQATGVCVLVGLLTNLMYSLLFSINGVVLAYRQFRRQVDATVAALFAVAGLGLIRSAFTRAN